MVTVFVTGPLWKTSRPAVACAACGSNHETATIMTATRTAPIVDFRRTFASDIDDREPRTSLVAFVPDGLVPRLRRLSPRHPAQHRPVYVAFVFRLGRPGRQRQLLTW